MNHALRTHQNHGPYTVLLYNMCLLVLSDFWSLRYRTEVRGVCFSESANANNNSASFFSILHPLSRFDIAPMKRLDFTSHYIASEKDYLIEHGTKTAISA
jgi:hypothetical protein